MNERRNFDATAPFEFGLEGEIMRGALWPETAGAEAFVHRYVDEWRTWHGAGCRDLAVCDMAAFIAAVAGSRFLPGYFLDQVAEWIEKTYMLENVRTSVPQRAADFSQAALALLRASRSAIGGKEGAMDAAARDALLQYALPVEKLLVLGGDQRLVVDTDTLLNGYGCRPFPRPEAITFSSSTATSISKYAFDIVDARRRKFINDAVTGGVPSAAARLAQEVRDGIARQIGYTAELAETVIAASGTDCFLIAQGLAKLLTQQPVVTLIIGVEESGSGVKLALQERHFANDTALANTVSKGQLLHVGEHPERQIDIPVRTATGDAVPARVLDNQVRQLVVEHARAGNLVVIHAMNHSKLGYCGPSKALLVELKKHYGESLCVVVDACQMRLDREEAVEYLEHGMIVIITGSKYFTGPPFCGAILVPSKTALGMAASGATLDAGFNSYCAKEDLSPRMRPLLSGESKDFNLGSLFRWVAALSEMARYYAIPAIIRAKAVASFCGRVEDILLDTSYIELHYQNSHVPAGPEAGELSGRRMIFPFFLHYAEGGERKLCTAEQVQQVYLLMNRDCSRHFQYKNAREFRLLAQMCHIGQPVAVMHPSGAGTAVLRISVGARIFSESYSSSTGRIVHALIEDEIWQIGVILGKIELLLAALSGGPA